MSVNDTVAGSSHMPCSCAGRLCTVQQPRFPCSHDSRTIRGLFAHCVVRHSPSQESLNFLNQGVGMVEGMVERIIKSTSTGWTRPTRREFIVTRGLLQGEAGAACRPVLAASDALKGHDGSGVAPAPCANSSSALSHIIVHMVVHINHDCPLLPSLSSQSFRCCADCAITILPGCYRQWSVLFTPSYLLSTAF